MPCLVLPSRPTTVCALSSELIIDSSVASMTARNRRLSAPSSGKVGAEALPSEPPIRLAVEKAMTKSPLPCEAIAPVRASPNVARLATRVSCRWESGAFRRNDDHN